MGVCMMYVCMSKVQGEGGAVCKDSACVCDGLSESMPGCVDSHLQMRGGAAVCMCRHTDT
jgi:hypothetical protein